MPSCEPERYELAEGPAYRFEIDRRGFLKTIGGGLTIILLLPPADAFQESGGGRQRRFGRPLPQEVGAWLHVSEDGAITAYTGKVEIGQNIRTSLAQVVAEELRVPLASVRLVMADTDLAPYDPGTFGSMTTPVMSTQLRKAAAAAREALIEMAAARWHADPRTIAIANGQVTQSDSGQLIDFGRLTRGQKLVKTISADVHATPAADWKIAGTSAPKVNGRDIVTGRHRYTPDIQRPGMLFGKVLRPPAFQSKLIACDVREAERLPGVTVVRDGNFIGVAAADEQAAARAREVIRAKWQTEPQTLSAELFAYLKAHAAGDGSSHHVTGSVTDALAAAHIKLSQTYTVAYIAHAPLEPRAAVAEWSGDKLTVWTGTQRPFGVRTELAEAFGMPEDHARVIVPDMGSGYGGKHTGEAAIEAARLAKAAGKPVKLVWTREEEFTWAYFRPAGVIEISSGLSKDGALTAWEFHNYNSGAAGIRTMYDVPNQRIEFHPTKSPLRQGSYRALAATANHFARETHMDELAHAIGIEPLEFRRKNLKDARLRAVLDAAADRFGWGRARSTPGHGFGIAGGFEKGAYVATCAEVSTNAATGKVKVMRVVTAFDCGAVVNPDHLKNQIEGAIVMGIGGALFEAIQFENGRIVNSRFSRYRVPRFSDAPTIEVVLLDHKDLPSSGAGETPIVCLAPAVGNAIFHATGVRLRSLPMAPEGLKA